MLGGGNGHLNQADLNCLLNILEWEWQSSLVLDAHIMFRENLTGEIVDSWVERTMEQDYLADRKEQSSCAEQEMRHLGKSLICGWFSVSWFPFPIRVGCSS